MELTNEQQGILANILAQLKEIMQMQAGEEETAPEELESIEMQEDEEKYENEDIMDEEEEKKEDEKEDKEKELMKSDEGTHGEDKAEDRIEDDLPEETKQNISEVSKAILALAAKTVKTKKSKTNKTDAMLKAIDDLIKVNKGLVVENVEQRAVLNEILEGLGISNTISKSLNDGKTIQKSKPSLVEKSDRGQTLDYLKKELGLNQKEEKKIYGGNSSKARNLIKKALPGIFDKKLI